MIHKYLHKSDIRLMTLMISIITLIGTVGDLWTYFAARLWASSISSSISLLCSSSCLLFSMELLLSFYWNQKYLASLCKKIFHLGKNIGEPVTTRTTASAATTLFMLFPRQINSSALKRKTISYSIKLFFLTFHDLIFFLLF